MKLEDIRVELEKAYSATELATAQAHIYKALEEIVAHQEKEMERVKRYRERKKAGEPIATAAPVHKHEVDPSTHVCSCCGKNLKEIIMEHELWHQQPAEVVAVPVRKPVEKPAEDWSDLEEAFEEEATPAAKPEVVDDLELLL